jgi:hypothetical protein
MPVSSKTAAILLFMAASFFMPLVPGLSQAANLQLHPYLVVNQIYDDNLFNDPNRRVSEHITRILPGLGLIHEGPRLDSELFYGLDVQYYLGGERDDEISHLLQAKALLTVAREWLFVKMANEYGRASLDPVRDFRQESLFLRQVERNDFSLSPYMVLQPTSRLRLRPGYQYSRIDYSRQGVDRQRHGAFVNADWSIASRTVLEAGYLNDRDDAEINDPERGIRDLRKEKYWGGVRYKVTEQGVIFLRLGETEIRFDDGPDHRNPFWDAGLRQAFATWTAALSAGVDYVDNPEGEILRREKADITINKTLLRSELALSLFREDYLNTFTDSLEDRRYGTVGNVVHELTPRLNILVGLAFDEFQRELEDTERERFIGNLAFDYQLTPVFNTTISYYHIRSHSPQLPEERYRTNRLLLELRSIF